jgi:hypothetical protein
MAQVLIRGLVRLDERRIEIDLEHEHNRHTLTVEMEGGGMTLLGGDLQWAFECALDMRRIVPVVRSFSLGETLHLPIAV